VYRGSRSGKAEWSETSYSSPCTDPNKELSPLEGVGEHSFLFHKEAEEAMEGHSVIEGKGLEIERKRKQRESRVY